MFSITILVFLVESILQFMEISEFFTLNSFTTLGSSAMIVYVICNALQHVFKFNPRLIGFILSLTIAAIGTFLTNKFTLPLLFLSIANGCLIYCTSVGLVQIISQEGNKVTKGKLNEYKSENESLSKNKRNFFTKWY